MFLPSSLPIVQAPMAGAQGPALAIAVCQAGGLGSLPCAMLTPAQLREQIGEMRAHSGRNRFNVNFSASRSPSKTKAHMRAGSPSGSPIDAEMAARSRRGCAGRWPQSVRRGDVRSRRGDQARRRQLPCSACRTMRCSTGCGGPARSFLQRHTVAEAVGSRAAASMRSSRRGGDGRRPSRHRSSRTDVDARARPLRQLRSQASTPVRKPVVAAGAIADGRGVAACLRARRRGGPGRHRLSPDAAVGDLSSSIAPPSLARQTRERG